MAITTATQSASLSSHLSERKIPHSGYSLLPADPPGFRVGEAGPRLTLHMWVCSTHKRSKSNSNSFECRVQFEHVPGRDGGRGERIPGRIKPFQVISPLARLLARGKVSKSSFTHHTQCVCVCGCVKAERKPQILLA